MNERQRELLDLALTINNDEERVGYYEERIKIYKEQLMNHRKSLREAIDRFVVLIDGKTENK